MTKSEKIILACLVFFLILGIVIRVYQERAARVDFRVLHSGENLNAANNKVGQNEVILNLASAADLEKLPELGPKMAEAIV